MQCLQCFPRLRTTVQKKKIQRERKENMTTKWKKRTAMMEVQTLALNLVCRKTAALKKTKHPELMIRKLIDCTTTKDPTLPQNVCV